jgi:hypothetical protein
MTKREIIRQVRDTVTGSHGHEAIQVWKKGRSWKAYSSFESVIKNCVKIETTKSIMFRHDRNEATLAEVTAEFDHAVRENL